MTKQARQYAIREIIATKTIGSQDTLRLELRKRGCDVTQATLSRDMKELGVSRVAGSGGGHYALQAPDEVRALRPLVNAEILSIDANESMIVVRTLPGCASTVGEFIDVQRHPDVIGTVAGDNTLLIIPGSQKKTHTVLQFLKTKLIEGQE
ncbi:MAG TPA: arginine repressor [Bacteroidota bacterium]|nr:arginine repressor [Bacteroidota bacterium]